MKFVLMSIHIGKLILARVKELGILKNEFARKINKTPQNVQDIFRRNSIDTELLLSISKALNFNFLTYYVDELNINDDKDTKESVQIELKDVLAHSELDIFKNKYIELLEKYNELLSEKIH